MTRLALPLVWTGTLGLALGYAAALLPAGPPAWAPFVLAWGTGALLSGLLALGATRRDRLAPGVGLLFLGTGLWVAVGLSILLALPGVDAGDAPLVLGLPRRAAFLLLGVGVAPGLVVPVAYGLVFDRHTLAREDLEELRRVAAEVAAEAATGAPPGRSPS